MPDPISVYGGQSPEEVALKLFYIVSWGENIDVEAWGKADRKWILDTYAQCLLTVKDPSAQLSRSAAETKSSPSA